jgi:4-amino-4-deoxy-L-arabinose transferase-like glycosyltransferase
MQAKDTDTIKGQESRENLPLDFLIASVLFIISLILRGFNYMGPSAFIDEIAYSSYAYTILSENWSWPAICMIEGPILPYILAALTYLFGGGLDVHRVVPIIFGSSSVWVMYFLGKELFDRRVGILSATLLCFSSYHILFSKVVMLEAAVIFFILASIYYFLKTYNSEGDIKYACICGVFLGLACNTKWIGLLLYPVFFLFIIWTKKSLRLLFEKRFLLVILISVLIELPVHVDTYIHNKNPIYYFLVVRPHTPQTASMYAASKSIGIEETLVQGFNGYIDVLIDAWGLATSSLPWLSIFRFAASLLFVVTVLYCLYVVLKGSQSASLVFIYFVVFNVFVFFIQMRMRYYLLWALPAFFIMLSSMSFAFIDQLKSWKKQKSFILILKISTLIFAGIFVFSYILVGTTSPYIGGEEVFTAFKEPLLELKERINPGDSIAASTCAAPEYYLYEHTPDFHLFPLYKKKSVNLKMLKEVKPRFLIIHEQHYYSVITSNIAKKIINEEYELISSEEKMLLFERKYLTRNDQLESEKEQRMLPHSRFSGTIDSYIFSRSIKKHMTIGKKDCVPIFVKNTGEAPATFLITLEVPQHYIYSRPEYGYDITLDSGESHKAIFLMMPIKQHIGELNITARLYLMKSDKYSPASFVEVDNTTTSVSCIKNAFSPKEIVRLIVVTILITSSILLLMMKKFKSSRGNFNSKTDR